MVDTKGAGGQGHLEVTVVRGGAFCETLSFSRGHSNVSLSHQLSPSQRTVPCKVQPRPGEADVRVVRYVPTEEGVHAINVSYDGHAVPGSPFPVDAQLPPDPSKVQNRG